ncbi:MAG: hypothetical protein LCI02_03010 [Proteobacteria bacterium]|nr:hypothetical protein [Pseudomonadota bacterium]
MTTPASARRGASACHLAAAARRGAFALTAVAAAALLAGCLGGGDDDGVDVPGATAGAVPDSALASSAAYTQFTLTTAQSTSETAEPLTAANVGVPPASETDEPAPVT